MVETIDNNLVASCLRIMTCFILPYVETEVKKVSMEDLEYLVSILEPLLLYAMIWSFGCTTTYEVKYYYDFIREENNSVNT